ncbi:hypothetical protein GCM10009560_04900 [Nonomuraea longicatena]|uniref:Uncharacterized protein n=1 Tax=Nonomuraea longicatena TaxID=83682 RepID=A0ABN1NNU7_9ACTN
MSDRGHEVGQGLAGARAGLHGEMLLGVDGPLDGVDHLQLAGPIAPSESGDRGFEKLFDWREVGVRHGTTLPAPAE